MQNKTLSRIKYGTRAAAFGLAAAGALLTTGCGVTGAGSVSGPVSLASFQGKVFGGQQPVSGATIQLYAANQIGYGLNATALISSTVTSDTNGNFGITGAYTCPFASSQVYLTATGGNSGSGTNPSIVMMAPLGSCSNLTSSSFIIVNELTTVAGAYSLAPFMSSPTQLSTSAANITGLTNAFATVNKLVNVSIGQLPGNTLPAGATEPVALINTLADILASCVNSASGSSNCSGLFTAATPPGGTAPTDTLTAALNIAKYPGNNTAALFVLAPAMSPFQPTLATAPSAYTISLRYAPPSTFATPSASAVDASGNVWVTNSAGNSIAVMNATTTTPTIFSGSGLNAPSAIAFDASGNAWVPNKGNSTLSVFTPSGTGNVALTSNLSSPSGVAIDGLGMIWVVNSGNNQVTGVTASGISVTGSTTYATGGTGPVAVAINPN